MLRRVEHGGWARCLAASQRLGVGRLVPAKPLVFQRPHHLELGHDGEHLLVVDVVPHGFAAPPCSQFALPLRHHNQRPQLHQLAPRRPLCLDSLETGRRSLIRVRALSNLIHMPDGLARRAGHQSTRSCLTTHNSTVADRCSGPQRDPLHGYLLKFRHRQLPLDPRL
jgi:hypothetical protein